MNSNLVYLRHIQDALRDLQAFVQDITFDTFQTDRRTQYAVMRAYEIIGEATRHLEPDFRQAHPEVPWRKMMDFRNKLIHDYFGLDLFLIWQTTMMDAPPLRSAIEQLLAGHGEGTIE